MTLQKTNEPASDVAIDAVKTVHTRTLDAVAGYETMVEKAEADFRHVPETLLTLHEAHEATLAGILVALGEKPGESGSIMAYVNQAVVAARALFDEIDEDAMKQIRDGEEKILKAFDETETVVLPEAIRLELRAMRSGLATALESFAHLN